MSFTAQDVKALRDSSGAGMMDCKKALQENDGDIEAAKGETEAGQHDQVGVGRSAHGQGGLVHGGSPQRQPPW